MKVIAVSMLSAAAVVNGFGPDPNNPDGGQCLDFYGGYCSVNKTCEYPVGATAWAETQFIPVECGNACTSEGGTCNKLTNRCILPSDVPCKSGCDDPNAFCDYFTKQCATTVKDPNGPGGFTGTATDKCEGYGRQGTCNRGEMCHPLFSQCVTLGKTCSTAPHKLYFSWINPQDECGDVDGGSRVPIGIFAPNNTIALNAYYTVTENGYINNNTRDDNGYLLKGDCRSKGYVEPAGSKVIQWAPPDDFKRICSGQCNCDFGVDCPDVPDDPNRCNGPFGCGAYYCSLCGPKFNSPIKVNFYT